MVTAMARAHGRPQDAVRAAWAPLQALYAKLDGMPPLPDMDSLHVVPPGVLPRELLLFPSAAEVCPAGSQGAPETSPQRSSWPAMPCLRSACLSADCTCRQHEPQSSEVRTLQATASCFPPAGTCCGASPRSAWTPAFWTWTRRRRPPPGALPAGLPVRQTPVERWRTGATTSRSTPRVRSPDSCFVCKCLQVMCEALAQAASQHPGTLVALTKEEFLELERCRDP